MRPQRPDAVATIRSSIWSGRDSHRSYRALLPVQVLGVHGCGAALRLVPRANNSAHCGLVGVERARRLCGTVFLARLRTRDPRCARPYRPLPVPRGIDGGHAKLAPIHLARGLLTASLESRTGATQSEQHARSASRVAGRIRRSGPRVALSASLPLGSQQRRTCHDLVIQILPNSKWRRRQTAGLQY